MRSGTGLFGRSRTLRQFADSSTAVKVLVINQGSFNLGFYMLLPYLAGYLTGDLGFAAWAVGLVLGVRSFSQQGMFVVGGTLADRLGYKPVIVAGCIVRLVGFGSFAVFGTLWGIVAAAVLSGFGAALFSPAVDAYLAHESEDQRAEAFSLFNVFGETGALLGPLVGVALLGVDFRLICVVASVLFLALAVIQVYYLPDRDGVEAASETHFLSDWKAALANRAFVLFALGMTGYFILFNQLYLALPFEVERLTGSQTGVGVMFALSSLLWVAAQMRTTDLLKGSLRPPTSIIIGLTLMGGAFLPPLLAGPLLPLPGGGPVASAINLSPVVASALILTAGMMVAKPFAMDLIPVLSDNRRLGTHYGLYYVFGGIVAAGGNAAAGGVFDLARATGMAALPWLALLAVGPVCAGVILVLDRRGAFEARKTEATRELAGELSDK